MNHYQSNIIQQDPASPGNLSFLQELEASAGLQCAISIQKARRFAGSFVSDESEMPISMSLLLMMMMMMMMDWESLITFRRFGSTARSEWVMRTGHKGRCCWAVGWQGKVREGYCWWFRNPKQPPDMYEILWNNGDIYQYQLLSRISSTVWMRWWFHRILIFTFILRRIFYWYEPLFFYQVGSLTTLEGEGCMVNQVDVWVTFRHCQPLSPWNPAWKKKTWSVAKGNEVQKSQRELVNW